MTFSERQGLKSIRTTLQTTSMDQALRNRLWNVLAVRCWREDERRYFFLADASNGDLLYFCKRLWNLHFKSRVDTIPTLSSAAIDEIRKWFFKCEWYEVYEFYEFALANYPTNKTEFVKQINHVLEEEFSGYRLIDERFVPISSEQEILAVERAITETVGTYSPALGHLQQALALLAKKPKPDYRNSIKESISGVEAVCAIVTGGKATLGEALKVIDADASLHGALRSAFEKLYGYTSDAEGIRHALLEEGKLEQEDAVFMLVTCSAFISYVIAKRGRKSHG